MHHLTTSKLTPYLVLIVVGLAAYSPIAFGPYAGADSLRMYNTLLWPGHPQPVIQSDFLTELLPWWFYLRTSVLHGTLPWWNHLQLNGLPLGTDGQNPFFDPVTWVALVFSFVFGKWHGFGMLMALRVCVGGTGTYYFLSSQGVRKSTALVVAIPTMLSAYFVNFAGWTVIVPFLYAPWILGSQTRLVRAVDDRAYTRTILVYILSVAFMLLAGNMEDVALVLYADLVWVAILLVQNRQNWLSLGLRLLWPALVGAAISSVEIIPFVENLRHSALWLARKPFAPPSPWYSALWLDPKLYSDNFLLLHETYNFSGTALVLYSVIGLVRWRKTWPALALFAFCFLVAYHIGPFGLVWLLPILNKANVWRLMALGPVFLAVSAASGIEASMVDKPKALAIGGVSGVLLVTAMWGAFTRSGQGLGSAKLLVLAAGLIVVAEMIIALGRRSWRYGILGVLAVLFAVNIEVFNPVYYGVRQSKVYPPSSIVKAVQRKGALATTAFVWPTAPLGAMLAYGIHDFGTYEAVYPLPYLRFEQSLWWPPQWGPAAYTNDIQVFQTTTPNLLRSVGVQYLIAPKPGIMNRFTQRWTNGIKILQSKKDVIFARLSGSVPLAYAAHTLAVSANPLTYILRHGYHKFEAITSTKVGRSLQDSLGAATLVRSRWVDDNELSSIVKTRKTALIVFNVLDVPGMLVTVNGKRVPNYAVNILSQAVVVRPGTSVVDIKYIPPGLRLGFVVCVGGVLLVLIFLIQRRLRTCTRASLHAGVIR